MALPFVVLLLSLLCQWAAGAEAEMATIFTRPFLYALPKLHAIRDVVKCQQNCVYTEKKQQQLLEVQFASCNPAITGYKHMNKGPHTTANSAYYLQMLNTLVINLVATKALHLCPQRVFPVAMSSLVRKTFQC